MDGDEQARANGGFPSSDSPIAEHIRRYDWSGHPFGPITSWSLPLRGAVTFMLDAVFPAAMYLGPELRMLYNDAFEPILGLRHPAAFGARGSEVWPDVWHHLAPQLSQVIATGKGVTVNDDLLVLTRFGFEETTYWNYTFSPLKIDTGQVVGVLVQADDVTAAHLRRRGDRLLLDLDNRLVETESIDAMIATALQVIGEGLGAGRTGFAEVDVDAQHLDIRQCWVADAMPDISGRYPIGTFGNLAAELARGVTIAIEDNLTDPRTNDPVTVAAYAQSMLRSGIVAPFMNKGRYGGAIFVQHSEPRHWSAEQVALAEAATVRLWQEIVRVRADVAMRESEQRHRLIFEQAEDFMFTTSLDQRIVSGNPASARALGYTVEALIGRSISEFMAPGEYERHRPQLLRKLQHGGTTRYEVEIVGHGDRRMRWEINSSLARDRDGVATGVYAIARDVTERRAFEARRELLIHELNHRVKNTLSLVQALAHQSFRPGEDAAGAKAEFVGRLGTLAAAHDLLTREQWEGVTLAELVAAASATMTKGRIVARGPAVTVTPKAAVALAMALHELGTNAIKYGALSNDHGSIDVAWKLDGDRLRFDWHEYGGPPVGEPSRRGFGVRMIERALASDLDASVRVDFATTGVICTIDAPREGNLS